MILIKDDLISNAECTGLRWFFYKYRDAGHVSHCNLSQKDYLKIESLESELYYEYLKRIKEKILSAAQHYFNPSLKIEWSEITKMEEGSIHVPHLDFSNKTSCLTSITYLNDNYEGGETYMSENLILTPQRGKTIFFDGQKYLHGVNPVKGGSRYVMTVWYQL